MIETPRDVPTCKLFEKTIANYNPEFNHIEIDETHSADICRDCLDTIMKWQQSIYAKLFPTKALKKRFRSQE